MFSKLKTWLCTKICGCEYKDVVFEDYFTDEDDFTEEQLTPDVPKKGKSKGSGIDGTPKNRLNKRVGAPSGSNTDD